MEKNIIEEEGFVKGYIEPVSIRQTETILKQMKKSVCKIFGQNIGNGFFYRLEIKNNKIPVLITNFHVIDDKFVESNQKIKIFINNDSKYKIICLNKEKRLYSSAKYDIMIIKLEKGDGVNNVEYLELDDSLSNNDLKKTYENCSIYILNYMVGNEIKVSYGKAMTNKGESFEMGHNCYTILGSSCSPIFNLSTNKLIGIHKNYVSYTDKNLCYNLGTFLKYPLKEIEKILTEKLNKISKQKVFKNKKNLKKFDNISFLEVSEISNSNNPNNPYIKDNISRNNKLLDSLNNSSIFEEKETNSNNTIENSHEHLKTDITNDDIKENNYRIKMENYKAKFKRPITLYCDQYIKQNNLAIKGENKKYNKYTNEVNKNRRPKLQNVDIVDNRLINNSSNKNKNVVKLNNKRIVITKERNKDNYSVAKNNLVKHKVNQNFRTPKKEPRKNKYSIN